MTKKNTLLETRFHGRMTSKDSNKEKYTGTLFVRGTAVPRGSGMPIMNKSSSNKKEEWTNTDLSCSILKTGDMDKTLPELKENTIFHGGIIMYVDELDALYNSYEEFEEVVVVPEFDPIFGQKLHAAAVPLKGSEPNLENFHSFLESKGAASYKFPSSLTLLKTLPKNELGAILRDEITL